MRRLALLMSAALLGCAAGDSESEPSPQEARVVEDGYLPVEDAALLSRHVGERVRLVGRISELPWQHMIASVPTHPHAEYFDVGDFQIVIYTREALAATGPLEVRGTVLEVAGPGKRPQGDERHVEYHLVVDEARAP